MNHPPCPHCGTPLQIDGERVTEWHEPEKEPTGCEPLLQRAAVVASVLSVVAIATAILTRCG